MTSVWFQKETWHRPVYVERNITASIAIDLQSMIEDNHVGFTRDELSYMLNNVCTMQLAVVFYHSPCCIIFRTKFFFIY